MADGKKVDDLEELEKVRRKWKQENTQRMIEKINSAEGHNISD